MHPERLYVNPFSSRSVSDLYKREFDLLPYRQARQSYLIATTPRSGSTLFGKLAWESGCLGAPLEYLNLKNSYHNILSLGGGNVEIYWNKLKRLRTTRNRIFGVKMFWNYMEDTRKLAPEVYDDICAIKKVVLLDRADYVGRAISIIRARQSGAWFSNQAQASDVEYDQGQILAAIKLNYGFMCQWEQFFAEHGINPLRIDFKDVVENPSQTIRRVADYLGITLLVNRVIELPLRLERQADQTSLEWRTRFCEAFSELGMGNLPQG